MSNEISAASFQRFSIGHQPYPSRHAGSDVDLTVLVFNWKSKERGKKTIFYINDCCYTDNVAVTKMQLSSSLSCALFDRILSIYFWKKGKKKEPVASVAAARTKRSLNPIYIVCVSYRAWRATSARLCDFWRQSRTACHTDAAAWIRRQQVLGFLSVFVFVVFCYRLESRKRYDDDDDDV